MRPSAGYAPSIPGTMNGIFMSLLNRAENPANPIRVFITMRLRTEPTAFSSGIAIWNTTTAKRRRLFLMKNIRNGPVPDCRITERPSRPTRLNNMKGGDIFLPAPIRTHCRRHCITAPSHRPSTTACLRREQSIRPLPRY